jgi:iron complex transport system permease protein
VNSTILKQYSDRWLYAALGVLLLVLSVQAVSYGPLESNIASLFSALAQSDPDPSQARLTATFWHLRLPRVALALMAGASLAVAGVTMQALFRNPLAEPGLTGSASGAALAAAAVLVLGLFEAQPFALPIAAFGGALCATALILLLPATHSGSIATLLLLGIAINAIAAAGLGFLSFIADDFALRSLTFWQFGSLGKASWPEILWASAFALPAMVWLLFQARRMNSLLLGEADALCLGVSVKRFKIGALIACSLCVGAAVACAGIIAFVGLVVPHLLRLLLGPDHRRLLPASVLAAPALLMVADAIARSAVSPAELPIGILTSLIGGPFFVYLLLRPQRNASHV